MDASYLLEISASFTHVLQDIAMNVHGALCLTFWVEYIIVGMMCPVNYNLPKVIRF